MMIATGKSLLAGLALALALSGCASDVRMQSGPPNADMLACARTGGSVEQRGRAGRAMCVHPFGDAGKSCSSSSDCQGRCLAVRGDGGLPSVGTASKGQCQADDKLFGCFAELKDGKVKSAMCID